MYSSTDKQLLLLDKPAHFRNNTISLAVKLSEKIDHSILVEAFNKEIERNEGLRCKAFKKFFKWKNEILEPFKIDDIKTYELNDKSQKEVEAFIDELCKDLIVFKKVDKSFEIYQVNTNSGDYIVLRVLHAYMDACAILITLNDLVKVYYSIKNNTELTDSLSSIGEYITNYDKNFEKFLAKQKEDSKFFKDFNNSLGQPWYLGLEGGWGKDKHSYSLKFLSDHEAGYYQTVIDSNVGNKAIEFAKNEQINFSSLFIAATSIYCSAVNDKHNDFSMFFTSNLRAKMSEKKLPFTTSTAVFFRKILNKELSFRDYIKSYNDDYLVSLKHSAMQINEIYKYLMNVELFHIDNRYEQINLSFLPSDFSGTPDNVKLDLYLPKDKMASDFIVYNILVPNKDNSFTVIYRYFADYLKEEDIKKLIDGIKYILKTGFENPDIKVDDLMNVIRGE